MARELVVGSGAWWGSADLKAEVVARMEAHREADSLGQGWSQIRDPSRPLGYRGCLIGCMLPMQVQETESGFEIVRPTEGWVERVESEYGIPASAGYLIQDIFEGVLPGQCADFAVAVVEAIPIGVDLHTVVDQVIIDHLMDGEFGVIGHAKNRDQRKCVERVAWLYAQRVRAYEPEHWEWDSVAVTAIHLARENEAIWPAADAARFKWDVLRSGVLRDVHVVNFGRHDSSEGFAWAAERALHYLANAPTITFR